ncbi:hypothetical protein [Streptomyces decoyicus]|uniref:hypothetical protein n=1 Tax=Streptomyces decoyicus TaxID=249567 RepID=UPI0037F3CAD7
MPFGTGGAGRRQHRHHRSPEGPARPVVDRPQLGPASGAGRGPAPGRRRCPATSGGTAQRRGAGIALAPNAQRALDALDAGDAVRAMAAWQTTGEKLDGIADWRPPAGTYASGT